MFRYVSLLVLIVLPSCGGGGDAAAPKGNQAARSGGDQGDAPFLRYDETAALTWVRNTRAAYRERKDPKDKESILVFGRIEAAIRARDRAKLIDAFLKGLDVDDENTRMSVVELAATFNRPAELAPVFLKAIRDDDRMVSDMGSDAIMTEPDPKFVPGLVAIVQEYSRGDKKPYPDVALHALNALAAHGPAAKDAAPTLTRLLGHREWGIRRRAAFALGKIGPTAKPAVGDLLAMVRSEDEDEEVRSAAAVALGKIAPNREDVIAELIEGLSSGTGMLFEGAVEGLKEAGPDASAAMPALTRFLTSEEDWERYRAADALGAIGPAAAEAVPALIVAMNGIQPMGRASAARALGGIGPVNDDVIPALIEGLHDKSIIESCAEGLETIGPEAIAAVPDLRMAFTDDDPLVRIAVAKAVWRIQENADEAVVVLSKTLEEVQQRMTGEWTADRRAFFRILDLIQEMGSAARAAVPTLIRCLKTDRGWDRTRVMETLGKIGPDASAAIPYLQKQLKHKDWWIRRSAADALKAIKKDRDGATD